MSHVLHYSHYVHLHYEDGADTRNAAWDGTKETTVSQIHVVFLARLAVNGCANVDQGYESTFSSPAARTRPSFTVWRAHKSAVNYCLLVTSPLSNRR